MRKTIFPGFLLSAFLLLMYIAAFARNDEKEPYMTRTFPAASIKNIEVKTPSGSIVVTGDAVGEAKLEVYITPNNGRHKGWDKAEIEEAAAKNYELDIKLENGTLYAVAKSKTGRPESHSIAFKISVPHAVNSDIKTGSGSLRLQNILGNQQIETGSGSVKVEDINGKIKAKTNAGSILLANVKDEVDISTGSGSIKANNCSGKITLNTGSGSIKLNHMEGIVSINTGSGSLHFDNIAGILKGKSGGGSVVVTNAGPEVNVSTTSGSVAAGKCNGSITLKSGAGSGRLTELNGTITFSTNSGSLEISDIKGTISAETGAGSIQAHEVEGTLVVGTGSGSVKVTGISGNLKTKTGSGSTLVQMKSVDQYVTVTNTHSGSIQVKLPAGKGYDLRVKGGNIRSMKNFQGDFSTGNIDGKIDGGGASVTINASSNQRVEVALE